MSLRCLFVDFNSYFAAVEQYDEPRLRGRPVGVVPVLAATTCCIAASVEAKQFGVTTGTPVWEAVERCPEIKLVEARPARYVELHHELMDIIQCCIPHGKAESIDEVPCYLIGRERQRVSAEAIARTIKQALLDRFGTAIRCSIGIAPNRFLAKTASDIVKPDGLTVIEQHELPGKLHALELRDFCGIGASMECRLQEAGIYTTAQLCAATREHLRAAWGSIEGERYWLLLRGFDLPDRETTRGSIGHSHVLGPELRSFAGARTVLFKLLAKAAMRLRHEGYLAGRLAIRVRFVGHEQRFERDLDFAPLDDTPSLLALLGIQLRLLECEMHERERRRQHPPLSVAVTLMNLTPRGDLTLDLIQERDRAQRLSSVLDRLNMRFGNNTVYFGAMQDAIAQDAAPMRIPFSKIPETALEQDILTRKRSLASAGESDDELWLQRERQFKALAEGAHREAQQRASKRARQSRADAGGWSHDPRRTLAPRPGESFDLF